MRWWDRLRRKPDEEDLDREIQSHLDLETEEQQAGGLAAGDAKHAARRAFGNRTLWREQTRETWGFPRLESLVQDVVYAARVLRRTPLLSGGAIAVLALGIGANCAIFTLVSAVLLAPLPYEKPEEVVMVWTARVSEGAVRFGGATGAAARNWRDQSTDVLSDLALIMSWEGTPDAWFDLVLDDRAERLRANLVTSNFFSVLGAQAAVGRVFNPADEKEGNTDVAVISHSLWQRAYGGDPGIVGRAVEFMTGRGRSRARRVFTVIGVLEPGFRFTYPLETEVWTINTRPEVDAVADAAISFMGAVGRLAPGVDFETAEARMAEIPVSPRVLTDSDYRNYTAIQPITEWVVGETRPSLMLMAGVSVLLLLIACTTVANTLLVRAAERRRELAVRASLGAGRRRLFRQLLTEGLVLSVAGAIGGVVLAIAGMPLFRSLVPVDIPRATEMTVDAGLLVFAVAVAVFATVLAALAPAIQASRSDLAGGLKDSSRSASSSAGAARWRSSLIAVQAGVATALLVGATLLLVSFWRLHSVDLGYDAEEVFTVEMRVIDSTAGDLQRIALLQEALIERVRAIPGVIEAGMTSAVPFRGVDWSWRYGAGYGFGANGRQVDPEYFPVMRIPLLQGRYITDADTASSPRVAVVSESVAKEAFGGDALGKQIDHGGLWTIVGVVSDVRYEAMDQEPRPAIYVPRTQMPSELICLVLRTDGRTTNMAATLRRAIHEVEPGLPAMNVTTIGGIISDSVADRRFYTSATATFAGLALLLTACGLVVVIGRSVTERRKELAIRLALGAQVRRLMGQVASRGMLPVVIGTAAGLYGAWAGGRILEQFLYKVTVHEPAVFVGAGALTVVVALFACLAPARRIGSLPPSEVLKSE